MNTKLIIWTVGLLLGAVIVGVIWYAMTLSRVTSQNPQTSQPITTFPISGSINTSTTGSTNITSATSSPAVQKMTVTAQDGSAIVMNDFVHNTVTVEDPSNAGNYYLAGLSSNAAYAIGYRTPAQSFTIAIQKEPVGATRIEAENFLLSTLGITQSQLCSLKYYIGTDIYTNSFYAGKNLGFSFCPGATVLPK